MSTEYRSVLTGDIVASTELSSEERKELPDRIRDAYRYIADLLPGALPFAIDIFRGDSIQIYVADPAEALVVAVWFMSRTKATAGVETRMALAVDTVEFINEINVSESDGKAFRRSGRTLNELGSTHLRCVAPATADPQYQLTLDVVAALMDHLIVGWTEQQAQAVALAIEGKIRGESALQKYIAGTWQPEPISQQAVSAHLQSATWKLVEKSFDWYRETVNRISHR